MIPFYYVPSTITIMNKLLCSQVSIYTCMRKDQKMSSKKTYYQTLEQKDHKSSTRGGNCSFISWFVLFICSLITLALVYLDSSVFLGDHVSSLVNFSSISTYSLSNITTSIQFVQDEGNFSMPLNVTVLNQKAETSDECAGKYIYVQDLPRKFNYDLLENCSTLNKWLNMCDYLVNSGLGPTLDENSSSSGGWFATNQFSLEVIFHNRMKQYKCLTRDSSKASAIFVPFYAGLDAGRYLWDSEVKRRDSNSIELARFLKEKPEWNKMWGRDHFLIAGRVSWDFRRDSDKGSDWGNCLFVLPEVKNMTSLVIESSPWNNTDFAIPYPTYFHPSSDYEVYRWQEKMRHKKRPYLFSFAGAPRPQLKDSIRNEIINQCVASRHRHCKFIKCDPNVKNCDKPGNLMRLFQDSVFCLQPPGDSYTRRSAFDAILAGCIPVFFHPGSAYVQYIWHLPKNYTSYSVFIPQENVQNRNLSIEKKLLEIPKEEVLAMREEVIRLIPRITYANPQSRLESFEDAFDVAVKEVLNRVERIKMQMKGDDVNPEVESFPEEYTWKYNFFGGLENHQWDSYFART